MEKHSTKREFDPVTNDEFVQGHDFDGIRELSNEPPYWLSFIFIISVLFAYTYFAKYHIFKAGDLSIAKYNKEMGLNAEGEMEESALPERPKEPEVELIPFTEAEKLNEGKEVFATNCAVCHLAQGQGLVGPNLTDEYWIHGGSYKDIVHTITEGVPAKGMISWKTQLPRDQILAVASYVYTLEGTNPPNPKEPQGEKYVRE